MRELFKRLFAPKPAPEMPQHRSLIVNDISRTTDNEPPKFAQG